jgi:hypothetical protein
MKKPYTMILLFAVVSLIIAGLAASVWAGGWADAAKKAGGAAANWATNPDTARKVEDLWEKNPPSPLDPPSDGGADPDYNPPGMPEVPTACGEDKKCAACYEEANKKIAKLRYSFEKLRILYKQTDDFVKAACAFGDSVAGLSSVGGLQWNHERDKIQRSFKGFEAAYRDKHKELLDKLKEALEEVAKCEEQYFGDKDWYARYGFMFHSFIALHYQK